MRTVPRVKICGIQHERDIECCDRAGVDAIGFLVGQVHPSSDFLAPELARSLIRKAPPFLTTVLVTHLTDSEEVVRLARYLGCQALQLHADLQPGQIEEIRTRVGLPVIAKVSVEDKASIEEAQTIASVADALVLDSIDRKTGQVGGTGRAHDWRISASIRRSVAVPVILAGGLHPGNVAKAIRTVRPWGVDVNTGVKGSEGGKSPQKVIHFVRRAAV